MEDRQQALGRECPQKQTFAALAVVDDLATDSTMQPVRAGTEIPDRELRTILAETVGPDPVGGSCGAQIDPRRGHRADRLHRDRVTGGVFNLDGDLAPRLIPPQLQD